MAVSLGGGSVLLIGSELQKTAAERRSASRDDALPRKTQGLVQLRVVSLDEDMDIQETSCYVHEGTCEGYRRSRGKRERDQREGKNCRSRFSIGDVIFSSFPRSRVILTKKHVKSRAERVFDERTPSVCPNAILRTSLQRFEKCLRNNLLLR